LEEESKARCMLMQVVMKKYILFEPLRLLSQNDDLVAIEKSSETFVKPIP